MGTTKNQLYIKFEYLFSRKSNFDLKVSLDRVHLDLNLCLWGYPPKGVRTRRTKKMFFVCTRVGHRILFIKTLWEFSYLLFATKRFKNIHNYRRKSKNDFKFFQNGLLSPIRNPLGIPIAS